jgi:branched-chain amino acid transport system substrate-binding protein
MGAALIASVALAEVVKVARDEPIHVGVGALLSGDEASLGLALLQGAEAYVQDHPIIMGHPVVLIPRDDRCDPATAARQAKEFCAMEPRPAAVVGYMCTSGTEVAMKVQEDCGIPLLNVTSFAPTLTQSGSPWIVRLWVSKMHQGRLMGYWIRAKSFKRVLLIRENDAASMAMVEALQGVIAKISPRPRVQVVSAMEAEINSRDLFPAKDLPQVVLYLGDGWNLADIWKNLPSGSRNVPWVVDSRVEVVTIAGETASQPKDLSRIVLDLPTGDGSSPDYQYFRGRFGEPGVYTLVAYDALSVLMEALQRTARQGQDDTSWDSRALADALRRVQIQGLTGPISFDAQGDRVQVSGTIQKKKESRWESQWEGRLP